MKKLSVFEFVLIPALAAMTIVIKLPFASIPGVEFTTPLFIAIVILLRRDLSLFYLIIFLIVDSLLTQKGNMMYIGINSIMWLSIYLICQIVKLVKWQQFRTVLPFFTGCVAVLLQSLVWFYALPFFTGTPILGIDALFMMWGADFVTGHPIVSGIFAVTLYFALIGITQTYRLKPVFDY